LRCRLGGASRTWAMEDKTGPPGSRQRWRVKRNGGGNKKRRRALITRKTKSGGTGGITKGCQRLFSWVRGWWRLNDILLVKKIRHERKREQKKKGETGRGPGKKKKESKTGEQTLKDKCKMAHKGSTTQLVQNTDRSYWENPNKEGGHKINHKYKVGEARVGEYEGVIIERSEACTPRPFGPGTANTDEQKKTERGQTWSSVSENVENCVKKKKGGKRHTVNSGVTRKRKRREKKQIEQVRGFGY